MGRRLMRTSLSLAAASLLFSMAAGAQDAATADAAAPLPTIPVGSDQPPPVPATATGDDQQGLAEIIVTAQKREQSLHDVPISVTAVGSEQLRDINRSEERWVGQESVRTFQSRGATNHYKKKQK